MAAGLVAFDGGSGCGNGAAGRGEEEDGKSRWSAMAGFD